MRILLTGAGGPSAISVWKSLDAAHDVFMADMDPCAAGLYLVPDGRRLILPRGDDPRLTPALLRACAEWRIDLLIPTVDAELAPVADARDQFHDLGVKVALSPPAALRLCRDKLALLNQLGAFTPVPETAPLTHEVSFETLVYPRFAKPRVGAGSRGAEIVATPADLARLPRDGSLLLQEFLPGEEYSVDVYVRGDGAVVAAVPRARMKTDSGIAITARTVNLPEVIEAAVIAARESGVRYAVNIQFRRDAEGVCKLLEINPRFPGTLPLTTHAGVDIPALMVAEMSGQGLPDGLAPFREVMVVRYWTERFFDADEWRALCPP